jgi:hypothetical protein
MDHPDLQQTEYLTPYPSFLETFSSVSSERLALISAVVLASGLVALLSLLVWSKRSSCRSSISSTGESRMAELGFFTTPSTWTTMGRADRSTPNTPLRPTRSSHQPDGQAFSPVVYSAWQPDANTLAASDGQRCTDVVSLAGQISTRSPFHVRTCCPPALLASSQPTPIPWPC